MAIRRTDSPRSNQVEHSTRSTVIRWLFSSTSTAMLLMVLAFVVYMANPRFMARADSLPARLLPYSILMEGNLDLNEFAWIYPSDHRPYFLFETNSGRWLSAYPIASALLALPVTAPVAWLLMREKVPVDDVRFRLATVVTERVAAAAMAALSVALIFVALTELVRVPSALAIAAVYAFGTSLWSTASQALWQHGPAALALAAASLMLVREPTGRRLTAAGAWLALAVLVRAPMVTFAFAGFAFVLRQHPRYLVRFLIVPITGGIALLWYNSTLAGLFVGGFSGDSFEAPSLENLAGLLVSPGRGLLLFTPLAIYGLVGSVRGGSAWLRYLKLGLWLHLGLYASWAGWAGGNCFGPRLLSEALPAYALCAAPAIERFWAIPRGRWVLSILAVWGVFVQLVGVFCDDSLIQHSRVNSAWNLRRPQILDTVLRCGTGRPSLAPLLMQMWRDPRPVPIAVLPVDALAGLLVLSALPEAMARGEEHTVHIEVRNGSEIPWPAWVDYGEPGEVLVEARWWGLDKSGLSGTHEVSLSRNLHPEESLSLVLPMRAPARPGRYRLDISVIQHVGFLNNTWGPTSIQQEIRVE